MSILHRPASLSLMRFVTAHAPHRLPPRPAGLLVLNPRKYEEPRSDVAHGRRKFHLRSPLEALTPPPRPAGNFPEVRLSPPRGWYTDPLNSGLQRRWDGLGWTSEIKRK